MKTNQRTWTTLAVVAMFCVTALLMAQGATKSPRPTRVAVVDVRKIFNSLEERTKMEADLNVMDRQIGVEKDEMIQKIKDMLADMELISKDDKDYGNMQARVEKEQFFIGNWMNWQNKRREREARLRTLDLYRKITKSVEDAAKEAGYDLVLYTDDINMDQIKPDEVSMLISSRRVMYAAKDLDITDMIITRMNNAYNNMPR